MNTTERELSSHGHYREGEVYLPHFSGSDLRKFTVAKTCTFTSNLRLQEHVPMLKLIKPHIKKAWLAHAMDEVILTASH